MQDLEHLKQVTKIQKEKQVSSDSLPVALEQLLNLKGIDWTGVLLGKNPYLIRKIPLIQKDSKIYWQLIEAIKIMEKSLLPASSTQIMKELTKLRLHFPGISMSEEEVTILMHDYISDMANYPIDIIESACREYIRDENSQYFPKLGRILSLMNKSWYRRKWKLKKLNILLSVSNNYKEFDNVQSK